MKLKFHMLLIILMALLVACDSQAATPAVQDASSLTAVPPSPTATGTATAAPAPTKRLVEATSTSTSIPSPTEPPASDVPAPTETAEVVAIQTVDWLETEGKTDDGYTYLGNPNAPVTMIDYSDFL